MNKCRVSCSNKLGFISLPGNPSTGYDWEYNIKDDCVAKVIKEDYISDDSNCKVGVGGKYIWVIKGLEPGRTEIVFKYGRPWENQVLKTVTYMIRVDSRLNVTIMGKRCCNC